MTHGVKADRPRPDFRNRKIDFWELARWSMNEWFISESEVTEAILEYETLLPYSETEFLLYAAQSRNFGIEAHVAIEEDGSVSVRTAHGVYVD